MLRNFSVVAVFCVVCFASVFGVKGASVTVPGQANPWVWEDGGLNSNFKYGTNGGSGYGGLPPTVVPVSPGTSVTLTHLGGSWSGGGYPWPWCDASGYPEYVFTDPSQFLDSSGCYCPLTDFPINWMTLIGVFTDASGSIIDTPYAIRNARTLLVPAGASQLQLGVEDSYAGDNRGEVTINITAVPEPSTLVLLGIGAFGLLVWAWRRRNS